MTKLVKLVVPLVTNSTACKTKADFVSFDVVS